MAEHDTAGPEDDSITGDLMPKEEALLLAQKIIDEQTTPPPPVDQPTPPPNSSEKFCINDQGLKLSIPMRDASDAQLKTHLEIAQKQHAHFMQQTMNNLQQAMMIAQACAALAYEIDRRAKSFQIVTVMPANISDIRRSKR